MLRDGGAVGPGRAALPEAVQAYGSNPSAGRALGMSYRRTWALIEAMNDRFQAPLMEAARGGASGGGARLTNTGEAVLALHRRTETLAATATTGGVRMLASLLQAGPGAGPSEA